jgi:hypothetical protein
MAESREGDLRNHSGQKQMQDLPERRSREDRDCMRDTIIITLVTHRDGTLIAHAGDHDA